MERWRRSPTPPQDPQTPPPSQLPGSLAANQTQTESLKAPPHSAAISEAAEVVPATSAATATAHLTPCHRHVRAPEGEYQHQAGVGAGPKGPSGVDGRANSQSAAADSPALPSLPPIAPSYLVSHHYPSSSSGLDSSHPGAGLLGAGSSQKVAGRTTARRALLFRYGNPALIIPVVPRRESARISSVVAVRVVRAVLVLVIGGEPRR